MALEDYRSDMETCCRCSACKFIPLEKVAGYNHANVCPSVSKFNFHAYSGGGRVAVGVSMLENRVEYTDKLLEVIYNCTMCGACDISCKYGMDMEVQEPLYEMRIRCVETGHTLPRLDKVIDGLRKTGAMTPRSKTGRGEWCRGLDVKDYTKEKAEVIYHAGCLTCHDQNMQKLAAITVSLLKKAGVDVGIAGEQESCCGGRAYQMGYREDALNQARRNTEAFRQSGAKLLVTGCADCYQAFKVLYEKFGLKGDLEVLHTTEYLARLIKQGELELRNDVNMKVTYHDPCHLGRLGEPYNNWQGTQRFKHMRVYDPPRVYRRGTDGIYEPPREVIRRIPGVRLVEMDRIKEYAWCCGAGGGVRETNPDFANWTAAERIKEAEATGAEALVTACPHCESIFNATAAKGGSSLKIYDIVELLEKAV